MSGEGIGYILAAPIVIGAVAVAGVGFAAYGIGKATWELGSWGVDYARKRKQEKEARLESEIFQDLEKINRGMKSSLRKLDTMSDAVFEEMHAAMKKQNQSLLEELNRGDGEAYQEALRQMDQLSSQVYRQMEKNQKEFEIKYENQMQEDLQALRVQSAERRKKAEAGLQLLEQTQAERQNKAKEIALQYIAESEKVYEALKSGFCVEEKDSRLAYSLVEQLNTAKEQFGQGSYEAAIATAMDFQMAAAQTVYDLEKKDMIWDHAYQMAVEAVGMVHTYLDHQSCLNQDVLEYLAGQGIEAPEELQDVEMACYAERNVQGENCFLEQQKEIRRLMEQLNLADRKTISAVQLKQLAEEVYTKAYPQALQNVNDAMMNLSNAYYRSEKAGEFMDFLEDRGLEIHEAYYVDEEEEVPDYTVPIEIVVKNPVYDEIVVYCFEKQARGQAPAQVNIKYHLAKGNVEDESRNRYYQGMIGEFLEIEMHCNTDTVGQTSEHISETAGRIVAGIS